MQRNLLSIIHSYSILLVFFSSYFLINYFIPVLFDEFCIRVTHEISDLFSFNIRPLHWRDIFSTWIFSLSLDTFTFILQIRTSSLLNYCYRNFPTELSYKVLTPFPGYPNSSRAKDFHLFQKFFTFSKSFLFGTKKKLSSSNSPLFTRIY